MKISLNWPVWYHPAAPLGSAVRYIASLNPKYSWVSVSVLKGKTLKPGPSLGKPGKGSALKVLIRDPKKKAVGQIDVDSRLQKAFDEKDEIEIGKIADELGALWPKRKK